MGRRYRVFISHSANRSEEPTTQDFLDSLCGKLGDLQNIDVLVDQRNLQAGDEWCQRLYAWMGLCDAAVILLSPRAIRRESSTWVPREVNLLLWRKALDSEFLIIPTLMSGLQRNEIKTNPFVSDGELAGLQFADGLSDDEKIDLICRELAPRAAAATRQVVFDALHVFVEDSLRRFAPRTSVEETLADRYGDDPWKPYTQSEGLLAVKMVQHAVEPSVDEAISGVSRGSQPEYHLGARLFQALFPMRLPAEPACRLLGLCQQQANHGAVIVNCHDSWAVRMMLRAATGQLEDDLLRSWLILELPDGWGDDDEAEIGRYLSYELAEAVLGTGGWDLLSEESNPRQALTEHLTEFSRESGAPILVCTSFSPRWTELAPVLAARFPATVFLLWSGSEMPTMRDSEDAGYVQLTPALASGEDRRWNLGYRRKMQLIGRTT